MYIEDGTGGGHSLEVDEKNRAHVHAHTVGENVDAAKNGEAFNLHSGSITFSAAGTLMYLQNNEITDLVIEGLIIALGAADEADTPEIAIHKNPTGGDLLTDETAIAYNTNRNYGSTKALDADVYAGKSAGTVTGGDQSGLFFFPDSARSYAEIGLILPRGNSLAISLDPKLTSGTVKAYCVLITHLKDSAG